MDYWPISKRPTETEQIELSQMRLDYCKELYDREVKRKEGLRRVSEFYLTFITVLLGSILFNLDFLNKIQALLGQASVPKAILALIYVVSVVIFLLLIVALFSILAVVGLQKYYEPGPKNVVDFLFDDFQEYISKNDFLIEHAMFYAVALRGNKITNNKTVKWVTVTRFSLLGIVAFIALISAVLLQIIVFY